MYTGILGKVMINGAPVAYISNWSVEDTADVIEVTKLGSPYKEKMVGQQSWSASADGAVEFANVNGQTSGQAELFAAKHNGAEVECQFYLDTTKEKNVLFEGKGYIESLSVDLSAEDKGNISISISGTETLELKTPTGAK